MSTLLTIGDLSKLLATLRSEGFRTVGPVARDGAVTYADIETAEDLPRGLVDEQEPGGYRLRSEGDALFDALPGQASWKQVLFPAHEPLWHAEKVDGNLRFTERLPKGTRMALVGARPCELAAISIQDRVFLEGQAIEPRYSLRRQDVFIVAVECGRAAPTCFCTSFGTGPRVGAGSPADIVVTEIPGTGFVARGESVPGQVLIDSLGARPATVPEIEAAVDRVASTAHSIRRHLPTAQLQSRLRAARGQDVWDELEERCLACGNCTAVCPTCFCSSAVDGSSLDGTTANRDRVWASCFTLDFSYMTGHTVRTSVAARYRQWITHKLSTWVDQFDSFGCVGCGRCITWCPVGIDIVAEATRPTKEAQHA